MYENASVTNGYWLKNGKRGNTRAERKSDKMNPMNGRMWWKNECMPFLPQQYQQRWQQQYIKIKMHTSSLHMCRDREQTR